MLALVGRIPATIRWLLLVVLVGIASFVGGRYSARKTTTTTTTTTSTTSNTTSSTTSSNSSSTQQAQVKVVEKTVYRNQKTLKQDKDTDCTEKFDRITGKLVERHCVTKTSTTGTTTAGGATTGTTTGSSSGSSTSSSTGSTTSTTTGTTSSTTTTTTTTGGGGATLGGFTLTLVADLPVIQPGLHFELKPAYGIGLSHQLIGPLSLGASVFTSEAALVGLTLDLSKDWSITASAGMSFSDIAHLRLQGAYFGGSLDRRLLGPVWVGVYGYSDGSGGLAASIVIP